MKVVQFTGHKEDYAKLFNSLKGFKELQTYSPSICRLEGVGVGESLLQEHSLLQAEAQQSENIFRMRTRSGVTKDTFMKYCPLVDPLSYLTGGCGLIDLPSERDTSVELNNSAYVDSTFVQMASVLGQRYSIPNVVDSYGSFLGVKEEFMYDASEDLENLVHSQFFLNSKEKVYKDASGALASLGLPDFDKPKKPIKISTGAGGIIGLELDSLEDEDKASAFERASISSDDSSVSSRESNTSSDNESEELESEDELDALNLSILDFPVVAVAMEKLEGTLDFLLSKEKHAMGEGELSAALMQVIMALISFQKAFDLTHNDLHSSNIMYSRTDVSHLWYKVQDKYYKVPTFGKIWKVIDFGRAIFRYKDELFCSGSFLKGGDAYSQYNFGPCLDEDSTVVEPNKSFDLCRLGVSLLDIVDWRDMGETEIGKTIEKWCQMDDGKNILYKKNGEERYPNFKLYKMIARKVTKHQPLDQLSEKPFSKFQVPDYKIKKVKEVIDMDSIKPEFSDISYSNFGVSKSTVGAELDEPM